MSFFLLWSLSIDVVTRISDKHVGCSVYIQPRTLIGQLAQAKLDAEAIRAECSGWVVAQASVYPREIVKTALLLNSAALIMSHIHPPGFVEPGAAGISLTRHLKQAQHLIEVRLLDHTIVAGNTAVSLVERGQI